MPTRLNKVWVTDSFRSIAPTFGQIIGYDGGWHQIARVWVRLDDDTWGDCGSHADPTAVPAAPTLSVNVQPGSEIYYQLLASFTAHPSYGLQVEFEISRPGIPTQFEQDVFELVGPNVSSVSTGYLYSYTNYSGRRARCRISYRDTGSGLLGPPSPYSSVVTFS
jgi:hypothetical protein